MSYSFSVRGKNKAQAKQRVILELSKMAAGQPVHSNDVLIAMKAACGSIDALFDDPNKDVAVSMNGSSWLAGNDIEIGYQQTGVTVSVSLTARE